MNRSISRSPFATDEILPYEIWTKQYNVYISVQDLRLSKTVDIKLSKSKCNSMNPSVKVKFIDQTRAYGQVYGKLAAGKGYMMLDLFGLRNQSFSPVA